MCVAILHMSSIQSYFVFQSHYRQPYIPACNTSLFHQASGICYLYGPSLIHELLHGLPSCCKVALCTSTSRSTILAGLSLQMHEQFESYCWLIIEYPLPLFT